jgi:putative transposase
MPEFRRKPNRLSSEAYRGERAYFLTLCVDDRKRVFKNGALVNALLSLLTKNCCTHQFAVYAFCFMPNHLHLILVGKSDSSELAGLIRAFKGAATAEARRFGISNLWQKGFYDHVLCGGKAIDEAAWYIFLNPVRAGLAKTVEEWPYSGSFEFEWKSLAAPMEPFHPPWKEGVAT